MDKELFTELAEQETRFNPEPWYNPEGDCITCLLEDEAVYADRVDSLLTLYRTVEGDRVVGFKLKDVQALVERCRADGALVETRVEAGKLVEVSLSMLLLVALKQEEPRPSTHINRIAGYDEALSRAVEKRVAVPYTSGAF